MMDSDEMNILTEQIKQTFQLRLVMVVAVNPDGNVRIGCCAPTNPEAAALVARLNEAIIQTMKLREHGYSEHLSVIPPTTNGSTVQ